MIKLILVLLAIGGALYALFFSELLANRRTRYKLLIIAARVVIIISLAIAIMSAIAIAF